MKNYKLIQSGVSKLTASFFTLTFISFLAITPSHAAAGSDLRTLTSFNKIDISGPYKVKLVQGDKEQVLIEADDAVIAKILTKVENGELEIYHNEKINSNNSITITVTFKNVNAIECSGAIDLSGAASINTNTLDLDMSGASKMNLEITAENISMDISGAGSATLTGKSNKVELDISGTGSLSAASLIADDYDIEISGAGSAKVNAVSKLNVEISGAGTVNYSGAPKITKEISGAGSVNKL